VQSQDAGLEARVSTPLQCQDVEIKSRILAPLQSSDTELEACISHTKLIPRLKLTFQHHQSSRPASQMRSSTHSLKLTF